MLPALDLTRILPSPTTANHNSIDRLGKLHRGNDGINESVRWKTAIYVLRTRTLGDRAYRTAATVRIEIRGFVNAPNNIIIRITRCFCHEIGDGRSALSGDMLNLGQSPYCKLYGISIYLCDANRITIVLTASCSLIYFCHTKIYNYILNTNLNFYYYFYY